MLNVDYYFYYHLNPDFPKDEVVKYINEKDYDNFIKLYNKWGDFYLPTYASVHADEDYEHSVDTDITNKYNFKEITFCEYECG